MCFKRQDQDGEEVVSTGKEGKDGRHEGDGSQMKMVMSDVYHSDQHDGEEVHL